MRKLLIYMACTLLCSTAIAQERVYTLQDCLKEGIENNYSIKIQKNKESISSNNATLGNAGFFPTVDASSRYTANSRDNQTNQALDAGLDLNWTIFQGFNISTNYKKLKELKSQGELQTRITIENLIAEITAEYYNYIQQKIRLKNFRYAVNLSKERLRIVEQRYRIGNFSGLDYQQAKVDFNSDSSALMKQQEALQSSAITLNELLARENLHKRMSVADTSIEVNATLNFNEIMEAMEKDNASLLYARRESHIAELDYKITASQSYPYLKMNAGYGYTLNKSGNSSNNRGVLGADIGLTLGIKIFDGNNLRRERHNARINIENARLEQTDAEQAVKADLYNIWHAYQNNLQMLDLEQENLVTAKLNHEIAMERYMLGDLSGIEMREAQKSLLDAEERLLAAKYNTKLCEISLMQISGKVSVYLQ